MNVQFKGTVPRTAQSVLRDNWSKKGYLINTAAPEVPHFNSFKTIRSIFCKLPLAPRRIGPLPRTWHGPNGFAVSAQ